MMKQYDEIRIQNLEVFANHGVFQEETNLGQSSCFLLPCIRIPEKQGKVIVWKNPFIMEKLASL